MPGVKRRGEENEKRKRDEDLPKLPKNKKKPLALEMSSTDEVQAEILSLEENILESRKNYNNISTLLGYTQQPRAEDQTNIVAAVALCRAFCRLMAAESLDKTRDSSENETTIVQWLQERFKDYKNALLQMLASTDRVRQSTALTLLMRLVKEERSQLKTPDDGVWRRGMFSKTLRVLVENTATDETRDQFVEKYLTKFDDVRYYTFACLANMSSFDRSKVVLQNELSILAAIPEPYEEPKVFFAETPDNTKHDYLSLTEHRKQAQKAWMTVMDNDLDKKQRKRILELMSHRIAPWFQKVELLMDFLTDSFNVGGSTSLLALSGLFYLIQRKNLDYPQFYEKLYSLLDSNILHSKHRARFFRLLDTFLSSTHLPAALVASFIKRLSRLTLHAPPSGVVVVVPWIYNFLKNHPSCTFMIHSDRQLDLSEEGWGDPFLMREHDPMKTKALDSSLWEIHMLQNHYHPNVATIAKIISEQFTKQAYNLEDFLDHSYGTMLDAELSKDIKKPPEIEYEIPKKIFVKHDVNSGKEDNMLVKLWDFN